MLGNSLGILAALVLIAGSAGQAKFGWRCEVCQDAVKAVRATTEDIVTPIASPQQISDAASILPQLGCSQFKGAMRQMCQAMRQNFVYDA